MRRILQGMGAEVIHLGHNRSVDEVVTAALQEDVQGIAISSYQGGHVEYFKYMIDLLKARGGAQRIKVFGGGGGVIVASEIAELHAYGVERIYSSGGRPAHGPGRDDRRDDDALRRRPRGRSRRRRSRRSAAADETGAARARPADHLARERRRDRRALRAATADARRHATSEDAGRRHHRHRRRGQVEPHRRARCGACGSTRATRCDIAVISHRSVAKEERRRAARRPDPHERDRAVERRERERRSTRLHAVARDARLRLRDQRRAARRARGGEGRGLRPRHRRDLRHRPGRRGDRAARRRAGLRDDARVRRRQPAREDRHARLRRVRRDQQVRSGRARPTRCATSPSRCRGTARPSASAPTRCRCSARWPAASTTTASPSLYQAMLPRLAALGMAAQGPATLPTIASRHSTHQTPIVAPARGCAISPTSPMRCARTSADAVEQSRLAREVQQLREPAARMLHGQPTPTRPTPSAR